MRRFLPFCCWSWRPMEMQAQSEDDALRFAFQLPGGTAGGAGWCIRGGRCGPGMHRTESGWAGPVHADRGLLTPSLEVNTTTSDHYGQGAYGHGRPVLPQQLRAGAEHPTERGGRWRYNTFGLVYDRNASHYWRREADAAPVNASLLDYFWRMRPEHVLRGPVQHLPIHRRTGRTLMGSTRRTRPTPGHLVHPSFPSGSDVRQEHTMKAEEPPRPPPSSGMRPIMRTSSSSAPPGHRGHPVRLHDRSSGTTLDQGA